MGRPFNNITGNKYGRLTATSYYGRKNKVTYWTFTCDCGVVKNIMSHSVLCGETVSCGCYAKSNIHRSKTHGETKSQEYKIWTSIKHRCYTVTHMHYHKYGGSGILMCDEWKNDFMSFLNDMGRRPSKNHSIDRIDNDKGYYKENCRWATAKEQQNNRKCNVFLTLDGVKLTVSQWADIKGVSRNLIYFRLKKGWAVADAINKPSQKTSHIKGSSSQI